jgi:hypothetical protein
MRADARFDLHQFANRKAHPVEAHQTADGGIESTCLSFGDYASMQTHSRAPFAGRTTTPPSWALNLRQLGCLLARYMERRAGIVCPRVGTPQRRIVHAQTKILAAIPANVALLDRLCREADVRNTDTTRERRRVLEAQIKALDGKLVIDKQGPSLIVGIVHYFFRCGYDSPQTCAALNHRVSPVSVRQIASRLTQLWERMQNGTDHKPKPAEIRKAKTRAWWACSEYKHKQAAKEKAERAAETPEQRAARLKYANDYYYAHRDRIRAQQKANWKKRDKAMLTYRSLTPEQIEERRQKARVYVAKRREELNRAKRERHAACVAKMSEQEKAIKRAQSRAYADAHREHLRAYRVEWRAKKKAAQSLAAGKIAPNDGGQTST